MTKQISYSKTVDGKTYIAYFNVEMNGEWFTIGDHVTKVKGPTKFIGRILAIFREPDSEKLWADVLLDKNEASDHLQHVYPLEMFAHVTEK
jgi:hypothetical protein